MFFLTKYTLIGAAVASRSNAPVSIYEDRGEEVRGAEAAPSSIVTAAKRQEVLKENTLKPGPWTTLPVKKKQAVHRSTPSFTGLPPNNYFIFLYKSTFLFN
jgi:hypothetical protein